MDHQIISDLARAEIDERIRLVERERLARLARQPRSRRTGRMAAAAHSLRASLATWRARNQLGALSVPMSSDTCADSTVR